MDSSVDNKNVWYAIIIRHDKDELCHCENSEVFSTNTQLKFHYTYWLVEIDENSRINNFGLGYDMSDNYVHYAGNDYLLHSKSKNKTKIEIEFLKLRIEEMQQNGADFYLPITYKSTVERLNKLIEENPEYSF